MRSGLRRLAKPAYLYRPLQVLQRVRLAGEEQPTVRLPWGLPIEVRASEHVGNAIARCAVYEPAVTEIMCRLLHRGDRVIDAGANIGYFTGLMAACVGHEGAVLAFEPHPEVRSLLIRNADRWSRYNITIDPRAVSDTTGSAQLAVPDDFLENMGTATIAAAGIAIQTVRLDEVLGDNHAALLKLDIEGHELQALTGAAGAIRSGRIRHIIFEERDPLPTPVSRWLSATGFEILALRESFRGVSLADPSDPRAGPKWHAPTYLATRDLDEARAAVQRDGWRSLRRRSYGVA